MTMLSWWRSKTFSAPLEPIKARALGASPDKRRQNLLQPRKVCRQNLKQNSVRVLTGSSAIQDHYRSLEGMVPEIPDLSSKISLLYSHNSDKVFLGAAAGRIEARMVPQKSPTAAKYIPNCLPLLYELGRQMLQKETQYSTRACKILDHWSGVCIQHPDQANRMAAQLLLPQPWTSQTPVIMAPALGASCPALAGAWKANNSRHIVQQTSRKHLTGSQKKFPQPAIKRTVPLKSFHSLRQLRCPQEAGLVKIMAASQCGFAFWQHKADLSAQNGQSIDISPQGNNRLARASLGN